MTPSSTLEVLNPETHSIEVGENVNLSGKISGKHNTIRIGHSRGISEIRLDVTGSHNTIEIDPMLQCKRLHIVVGSHVHANHTTLRIGKDFSTSAGTVFMLYNSGNQLIIGEDCMFSNQIMVRCGDSPHLLFDKETGEFIDQSEGVFIGNHVWVGEGAYITKNVTIPDECVIGARSVVTKRFTETHAAMAGNPAKVVRRGVQWIRNRGQLVDDTPYRHSYNEFVSRYQSSDPRRA